MNKKNWHVVIPFFFGENNLVAFRGGSPVKKKEEYLRKTVESIQKCLNAPEIHVAVCNKVSGDVAKRVVQSVKLIDCLPPHLPYSSVKASAEGVFGKWSSDDIFLFTEDDQILYMKETIIDDIEKEGSKYFFSPHRWSKLFYGFGRQHRPIYHIENKKGILDNLEKDMPIGDTKTFNHRYRTQTTLLSAYAACWAAHVSSLQALRFTDAEKPPNRITLESGSFILFNSPEKPVLKLDLTAGEKPIDFVVDHLSGYDYCRRIFSLERIWRHIRKFKF